jgi:hypothetical protein
MKLVYVITVCLAGTVISQNKSHITACVGRSSTAALLTVSHSCSFIPFNMSPTCQAEINSALALRRKKEKSKHTDDSVDSNTHRPLSLAKDNKAAVQRFPIDWPSLRQSNSEWQSIAGSGNAATISPCFLYLL